MGLVTLGHRCWKRPSVCGSKRGFVEAGTRSPVQSCSWLAVCKISCWTDFFPVWSAYQRKSVISSCAASLVRQLMDRINWCRPFLARSDRRNAPQGSAVVCVEPGLLLRDLIHALSERGLTLPSLPMLLDQTVGGTFTRSLLHCKHIFFSVLLGCFFIFISCSCILL